MKGLPQNIRLRLLESNATLNLAEMLSFSQRFRALHCEASRSAACALLTHAKSGDTIEPLQQQQQQMEEEQCKIANLEDMIRKLSVGQDHIIAAISNASAADSGPNGRRDNSSRRSTVRCFRCHKEGHIARNCPQRNDKCGMCSGWGYNSKDCANNHSLYSTHSKLPLNFQGVPRYRVGALSSPLFLTLEVLLHSVFIVRTKYKHANPSLFAIFLEVSSYQLL